VNSKRTGSTPQALIIRDKEQSKQKKRNYCKCGVLLRLIKYIFLVETSLSHKFYINTTLVTWCRISSIHSANQHLSNV